MEDVIKNNRLIAEFMGYTFSKSGKTARIGKGKKPSAYRLSDLHYNDSWALLVPVVVKCKELALNAGIQGNIIYNHPAMSLTTCDIEKVYAAVINAIGYHNLINNKQ